MIGYEVHIIRLKFLYFMLYKGLHATRMEVGCEFWHHLKWSLTTY